MAMSSPTEDSKNFWRVDENDYSYWESYLSTRPNYSQSGFYSLMYEYHASHLNSFTLAHDIGCGPGQVTAQLLSCFDHVVASDNNPTSLGAAKSRLSKFPAGRVSFVLSTGEDIASHHPPESADFIAAAEMFPLMDAKTALTSFATVLKPGGTLAIWFYGKPHFAEEPYTSTCQPILNTIMDRNFAKVVRGGGKAARAGWKYVAEGMTSWFDYISFPSEQWENIRRWKWNPHLDLAFFGPEACDFDIQPANCIKGHEEVVETTDPHWWANSWDIDAVRKFVGASFPIPKDKDSPVDRDVEVLWTQLSDGMGGEGAAQAFTWPVVLILATRTAS